MNAAWLFQVRITVSAGLAASLRDDASAAAHAALGAVLLRHRAALKCQFDAFAEYVREAERLGPENFPLYTWTRQTIEDAAKKDKYLRAFTVYVDGEEVYSADAADPLHAELSALAGRDGIERVFKFDTNPANNPQPPARGR